jgi:hypothetical protein
MALGAREARNDLPGFCLHDPAVGGPFEAPQFFKGQCQSAIQGCGHQISRIVISDTQRVFHPTCPADTPGKQEKTPVRDKESCRSCHYQRNDGADTDQYPGILPTAGPPHCPIDGGEKPISRGDAIPADAGVVDRQMINQDSQNQISGKSPYLLQIPAARKNTASELSANANGVPAW